VSLALAAVLATAVGTSAMRPAGGSASASPADGAATAAARTRTYYIGADRVDWDYAPRGRNMITGRPFDETADTFVRPGPGRIGSRYVKCIYRYADAGFRRPRERPASERYLGLLGPVIRAEVGDRIRVVFRNACPFPASIHPHGVFDGKDGEGAPLGTEVDLHTPHWHGNSVTAMGMRMDTVSLLPAGMVVADMVPDDPGIWLFHCHVNDHILAGMQTRYEVVG
jgi:FtsP/CotA-like multicopper oxidase with cupredoxin domain